MKAIETPLPGVLLIEVDRYGDDRGYFMETWQEKRYSEVGISGPFVQDNLSFSRRGVLRGLHFQNPNPQGKLVSVLSGEVFDVAVDIRRGSPTFGQWVGYFLSERNRRQLWVPPGFAHGFCVTSESALFSYKCTEFYSPQDEGTIRWDDQRIGIEWPLREFSLSKKDAEAPALDEIAPGRLPVWSAAQ